MKNLYGFQRLAVVIVCTMLFTGGLRAANTMHMGSASMGPVQPITLRVSIDNSNAFVAFQFDLPIPAGFSYVGNSAALNPSRTSGQVLQAQLISGNILRVLGYSPNNIPFTGDTGTIMTFQLRSGTVPGEFPLSLQAPIIGDVNQVNILTGSFNGTATVLAPDINITVTSIDFDRTPLGQSTTRTLQIDNTGNQPLNILSITFNSSYFEVAGSSAFSISGGQTAYVTIRFNSIVKGYYNQVLTIVSNDPDETAIPVALQSHAFAVNELHTGSLSVFSGKQGTLSFSVNNMEGFTGFQFDLQLPSPMTYITGSATLSGRNTDHIISANMIPGNKLRIIAYSPTMQLFSGTDGNILNLNFMVVGAGGYYPLNIINVVIGSTTGENCLSDFYNGSLQIAAPDILCSNSLSFGDVSVLATGHQNFQIYNWGNDTLKIGQITFSDPSFFLASALPLNIMPYEGKSLQVAFHQTNEGASTGTMRIFSNDPEAYENPMLVALSALAFNPNYIIIPDFECRNIDTIVVPVKVSNIENFVGFQFDLNFPPILRYVPNSAELSVRAKDHLVVTQELGTTALRVVAFSLSQQPFTGDTGAVVCLKFTVNTQDQGNVSVPLTLTNALIGNAVSHNILYAVDNGILSVQFPHTLSGSFVYNNIYNTPLDSVWVFLTQNNLTKDSVRTLANGNYSFSNIYKGTYTLLANTNQPWAGVNGTDALKIMRYVAWLDPFSTHIRVTSADVNNSNSVSGMDVLKVKKRFVGLDSAFARGDWTFEKCSGGNEILMTGSDQVVDFYGLCVGDVNGSHIPGTGPKSESGVDISTTKQMTAKAGQEIFIPISIDSEFDLGALSLELEFPKNLVEIMEVNCVQGTPVYQVKENRINIVWAELTPIKVFPDEPVLFIKVKTSLSFQEGEIIQFVNASELTELSDIIAEPMRGITLHIPSICYSRSSEESEMLIFPNPARQFATLIFKVPEDGKITVSLCDNAGHQIFADHDLNVTEGLKNLNLNVAAYARGNYVLNLVFKGNNVSFREVKKLVLGM